MRTGLGDESLPPKVLLLQLKPSWPAGSTYAAVAVKGLAVGPS